MREQKFAQVADQRATGLCRIRIDNFLRADNPYHAIQLSEGSDMKSDMVCFAFTAAALLASTDVAAAQGTSGGNGAVASIPGSVVRGHEQGPGLISILSGSTPPNYSSASTQKARGIQSGASSQKTGK
jgi:hypothetical protein